MVMEKQKATMGQRKPFCPVQHIYQRKADSGAEEAVEGVEDGVPPPESGVVGLDFPQNLGGKNKKQDDDFHGVGQIDL